MTKLSVMERFWAKVEKQADGCWMWTAGKSRDGYGKFSIHPLTIQAHRFSYEVANGEIPKGMLVCHKCDVPGCVNPDHLFVGSHADNSADMFSKGRQCRHKRKYRSRHPGTFQPGFSRNAGVTNGKAKLTVEQVAEIRISGEKNVTLSRRFGVTPSVISEIRSGKSWASQK